MKSLSEEHTTQLPPETAIALIGPTASGKTTLAVRLAIHFRGEILSADSRQVYRRMDIGTGKDFEEYKLADGSTLNHHLIDIEEPGNTFDLYHWLAAFRPVYEDILSRKKTPILVGGTGLYLETALKGSQLTPAPQAPELRKELEQLSQQDLLALLRRFNSPFGVDTSSHRRTIRAIEIARFYSANPEAKNSTAPFIGQRTTSLPHILLLIDLPREERIARIHKRLLKRLQSGMVEEVEKLLAEGVSAEKLIAYGLEYRYITQFLTGKLSYEEAIEKLEIAIRQFSKRQMTWFRGMERRGFTVHRLDGLLSSDALFEETLQAIESVVAQQATA